MQPRNELAAAVLLDVGVVDAAAEVAEVAVVGLVVEGALDELLPHAATTRVAAAAAATAINAECFTVSSTR